MAIAVDDNAEVLAHMRAGSLDPDLAVALDLESDDLLHGRYALEKHIGTGMTSTVYAGYDLELERDVAIKRIKPEYQGSLLEAASAARVSDDNVASIFEVSQDGGYIIMELLSEERDHDISVPEEEEERRVIAKSAKDTRPTSLYEALRWVRDAAIGIAAAHRCNVWHGDVKPHNLLVLQYSRKVKLIDFGMASSVGRSRWCGTPEYIAPEVGRAFLARRTKQEAPKPHFDHAAIDMYGLGCLAYDLITNQRPRPTKVDRSALLAVAAQVELRAEWSALEHSRLEQALKSTPRFTKRMKTVWGRLPTRLANLLAPTLNEDPSKRGNPTEFVKQLTLYLSSKPLSTERRCYPLKIALWAKRYPSLALLIAGGIALIPLLLSLQYAAHQRDDLAKKSSQLEVKILNAEEKYESVVQRALDLDRRLVTALTELDGSKNKIIALTNDNNSVSAELGNTKVHILPKLNIAIAGLERARDALKKEVKTKADQIANGETAHAAALSEKDRQINALNDTVEERDGTINARNATISAKQNDIKSRDEQIRSRDDQINDLKRQIQSKDGQITELKAKAASGGSDGSASNGSAATGSAGTDSGSSNPSQ
jgi:serine/threonine protein kinase